MREEWIVDDEASAFDAADEAENTSSSTNGRRKAVKKKKKAASQSKKAASGTKKKATGTKKASASKKATKKKVAASGNGSSAGATKTTRARRRFSVDVADVEGRDLVIVESPAKAKTINKYLGGDFYVTSSMGHVRDLPAKPPRGSIGLDLDSFQPIYEPLPDKEEVLKGLKTAVKHAKNVYLATDPDREGEAIAWHLKEELHIDPKRLRRIEFGEITKKAIVDAIEKPRQIDEDRFRAQEARRFLDRLVGYKISPLLRKKISYALNPSAGRVQSVAVRLIVEREREIRAFVPHTYWTIEADLLKLAELELPEDKRISFRAELKIWRATEEEMRQKLLPEIAAEPEAWREKSGVSEKASDEEVFAKLLAKAKRTEDGLYELNLEPKADLKQREFVDGIVGRLEKADYEVASVDVRNRTEKPKPPFKTSTMQRTASTELRYGAARTMSLAQTLYETGFITYMRTDSTRLSEDAVGECRGYVEESYGKRYLPDKPRVYATKAKGAQEAHEAIRPTEVRHVPDTREFEEELRNALDPAQKRNLNDLMRLYGLIWRQFVMCQMADHEYELTTVEVTADRGRFRCHGRKLVFDGFTKLLSRGGNKEDDDETDSAGGGQSLPKLVENDPLKLLDLLRNEKETKPPPRFTEASLVKKLEDEGIGRPSTYAAIIDKIVKRKFVRVEQRRFFAEYLGEMTTDLLVDHFPHELAVDFTAKVEESLDEIEQGHLNYKQFLHQYKDRFLADLEKAETAMPSQKGDEAPLTDEECPKCGAKMRMKLSRFGKAFLSCSRYPECDGTMNVTQEGEAQSSGPEPSPYGCDWCGKPLVYRMSRKGRMLGCSGFPDCKNTKPIDKEGKPILGVQIGDVACPECDSRMVLRGSRKGFFFGCTNFPKCRGTRPFNKTVAAEMAESHPPLERIEGIEPVPASE